MSLSVINCKQIAQKLLYIYAKLVAHTPHIHFWKWLTLVADRIQDGRHSAIFTVRHVMQRTVLLSQFCLSLHPSVRRVYCDKTDACGYFDTTRNGNHSSFVTPTVVGGRCSLPCEIFAKSDPPMCETDCTV